MDLKPALVKMSAINVSAFIKTPFWCWEGSPVEDWRISVDWKYGLFYPIAFIFG
jgi:hypothetical protein